MIELTVKTLDSRNHAFSLENDEITVRGFKEHIAESVGVAAESQRLIYCGRVLHDDKKLNDYDVNGKVIHLVYRPPPQPGQRNNDEAHPQNQGQGQSHGQNVFNIAWPNAGTQRFNFVYPPAMPANFVHMPPYTSVSTETADGADTLAGQLNSTMCDGRLLLVNRMLNRVHADLQRIDDSSRTPHTATTESNSVTGQTQAETDQEENHDPSRGSRLTLSLPAAGLNNVTILQGNGDDVAEVENTSNTNDEHSGESRQQFQADQESSTSNTNTEANRRPIFHLRTPRMAEALDQLLNAQTRLRPYIERYMSLMLADDALPPGAGPEGVEESQRIVDTVSSCLHYMSHAYHALSDIVVDMGQQPPRDLRIRPNLPPQSAILQTGIPIRVEARISLHARNGVGNNGNETANDSNDGQAATDNAEPAQQSPSNINESSSQEQSEDAAQPQADQQNEQHRTQLAFGTMFSLPNNVEVLMVVNPENSMDTASGNEQPATNESNNNSTNPVRGNGNTSERFPREIAPPTADFLRNLLHAAANYIVQRRGTNAQDGITPLTIAGSQVIPMPTDSTNTNAGQSTQARSNMGTHPTTATQTRSTPRPLHQAPPAFLNQFPSRLRWTRINHVFDTDPYLPCNSHHVRRTPSTRANVTSTASQPAQSNEAPTSDTSSNHITHNLMEMFSGGNVHVGFIGPNGNTISGASTLADTMGRSVFGGNILSQLSGSEDTFSMELSTLLTQYLTPLAVLRLDSGFYDALPRLRRPLREFLQQSFPNVQSSEELQQRTTDRFLSTFRRHVPYVIADEEQYIRSPRIDLYATVESILSHHIKEILKVIFNDGIEDTAFVQEIVSIASNFARQFCAVIRYSLCGPEETLSSLALRILACTLRYSDTNLLSSILNSYITNSISYFSRRVQPPDSEIIPLLIYKDAPTGSSSASTTSPANEPPQKQREPERMETEVVEEKTQNKDSPLEDGEEILETFPNHEVLPPDWVPIIARDGVRQRRQLQVQGMTNGGVTAFSDAYLGELPSKRRKLIEQQKTRLLVSPTRNHSAITASVERLVREGVSRAGVEEIEGATIAVASNPGVRRAFGQAIRDCIHPQRYATPDFPDPLRFPNATKYFADRERPPK